MNTTNNLKLFTFDIETTGVHNQIDQIIQFAYQKENGNELVDEDVIYYQITGKLPEDIKELTKIDDEILNKKGVNYYQGLKTIVSLLCQAIEEGYYLGGHNNLGFDFPFILNQADRFISDDPYYLKLIDYWKNEQIKWKDGYLDAKKLANAKPFQKGFKNFEVATSYGISFDPNQLHDARVDVALSAQNIKIQNQYINSFDNKGKKAQAITK